jgi:acyl-CoA thioester hydrolase
MKEYEFNVRVRYAETDQMGWFIMVIMLSILRWDAWNGLETLGFHTNGWKKMDYAPVVSLNINYKNRYDDLLTVKTILKVRALLRSSLIMKFTMNSASC